ncbi:MAG: hypothetical protein JKY55_15955 [Aliivibrio sp.]|uniref:H-NS-like global regulator TsrA n=1 Tax=Aliivibrio sp. TaxID=1872443 RepID=UPI001A4A5EF2|nr:hypothetical protein [Aliivibrio sp.]
MSMSVIEMARVLEQLEESPEKMMFGKVLTELGNLSEERIRSAARKVPLRNLKDFVFQFQHVIEERKGERLNELAAEIASEGFTAEELRAFLATKK